MICFKLSYHIQFPNAWLMIQHSPDGLLHIYRLLQHFLGFTARPTPFYISSFIASGACKHVNLCASNCLISPQADHLREQTLRRMSIILNTRQAAKGMLAFGDYFQCLRDLGSLWAASPRNFSIQHKIQPTIDSNLFQLPQIMPELLCCHNFAYIIN